jgi:VanZ family protein
VPQHADRPALPDGSRRPLQGGEDVHAAQRNENVRGVSTTSWPLALALICLIVYASLYPFAGWRDQEIFPLQFLTAPLPQYWTRFDLGANFLGYAPLGFLLALSALRSRRVQPAVTVAVLGAGLLSLLMETVQNYLPSRIASNLDLALNIAGAFFGALFASWLQRAGVIDRWSRFRARWFTRDARGALVLLALWPVALLFPAAVPMGLGQVFERLEAALAFALLDSPFLQWMPVREVELQPLVPAAQLICVAFGALLPCLLGYCVVPTVRRRAVVAGVMLLSGVAASGLSAALTFGPDHAWAWLDLPVKVGLALAFILAAGLLALRPSVAAALAMVALVIQLGLLNQAPADPYFAQTLQTWEQGRFIRFHGVVQWLGWLWPYAALGWLFVRLTGRQPAHGAEP